MTTRELKEKINALNVSHGQLGVACAQLAIEDGKEFDVGLEPLKALIREFAKTQPAEREATLFAVALWLIACGEQQIKEDVKTR